MANQLCTRRASVIVCAFDGQRWPDLQAAVDSLRVQVRPADELIVVIDHNPQLLERAQRELGSARVVPNVRATGLSGARNSGVEAATGDVLAFIDDDACAEPTWLEALLAPYSDPSVIAVGGAVLPLWDRGRPRGFPQEFDWVVGCTYRGMPGSARPVRNLIGANMSFRRQVFDAVGGFTDGIGRVGSRPTGCEETELCIKAGTAFPRGVILYEPAARVVHRVPQTRSTWRYFGARCFHEGVSKAAVARSTGAGSALSSERAYATRTVPRGIARGLTVGLTGDAAGFIRATALTAGVGITTAGYVAGNVKQARARPRSRRARRHDAWLLLDIHDRVGIRIRANAPGARQLADMFAPFRVERLEHCELTVEGELEQLDRMVDADDEYRYRPDAVELPGRLQIRVEEGGFRLAGTGELLAPVLVLLDALMARSGAAMAHAATVARDGLGVCVAAAGGAGKTSAAIGLVRDHGFAFMGDDWTFLSENGQILGYPKPLFVRPHHRELFPQFFAQKRKPLAPPRLVGALGRIATAVHPIISSYPALAGIARRWWPEHVIVPPQVALPYAAIADRAQLSACVFVERTASETMLVEPRDATWMASRLVGDFFAALPRPARQLQAVLAACGLLAIDELMAQKSSALTRALEGTPCFVLRAPERMLAAESSSMIAQQIDALLRATAELEVIVA
jgi:glucosyl-dolichyl phosphate glucuronosyltransferase